MSRKKHNNPTFAGLLFTYIIIFLKIAILTLCLEGVRLGIIDFFPPKIVNFINKTFGTFLFILLVMLVITILFTFHILKDRTLFGILTLIFSSIIGGVILLLANYAKDEETPINNNYQKLKNSEAELKNPEKQSEEDSVSKTEAN